jgi:hypothetical protein
LSKKVGPFTIEDANNKIGEFFSQILPPQHELPGTRIKLHISESQAGIKWAVELDQPVKEFDLLVMKQGVETDNKQGKLLIIGDEFMPNGLFILYSSFEGNMIKLKFSTEEEALAYKNHFELPQYSPEKITRAIAGDMWFDGSFNIPDYYGYRKVMKTRS